MDDKALVVDTGEDFGGDFVGFEEVVEVGARVILTTFAVAVGHEWGEIGAVFSVLDVNSAILSIEGAIPSHAGGADTVESIAAVFGADEEVQWLLAHTEEVARFVLWENRIDGL